MNFKRMIVDSNHLLGLAEYAPPIITQANKTTVSVLRCIVLFEPF